MRIFLAFILIFATGCFLSRKQNTTEEIVQFKKSIFFESVPITEFIHGQCPCVGVNIEHQTLSLKLDLGFRGHITLDQDAIDQIALKQLLGTQTRYGIRGKEYQANLYCIPKITIGNISFKELKLREQLREFINDSSFQNGVKPSRSEIGRIGWELFQDTNLLIDNKNSQIAFCDSIETLKQQGYANFAFVRTPLFLERGFIEFEAVTPEGVLRCILDSGCTWNVINAETVCNKPIEKAIWDPDNRLEYSSFQIDAHDFGAISFQRIPINLPIPIGAFIGMEFLEDHIVFLDFAEGYVYFAKNQ